MTSEQQTRSLPKTASAVTAVSADALVDADVSDLREAQKLVPSARFHAEGNNTQVFIRGVGANLDQANVDPNVAFNFAGIYVPRAEVERRVANKGLHPFQKWIQYSQNTRRN